MKPETKAKHTPGPWKVVKEHDKTGFKGISISDKDGFIANLVMSLTDNELANARLIAAAPELLDAAKRIVSAWDGKTVHTEKDKAFIRAAIAKAEGK